MRQKPKGGEAMAKKQQKISDITELDGDKANLFEGVKADATESKKADKPESKKDGAPQGKNTDTQGSRKRVRNILFMILGAAALVTATVFIVLYILGDEPPIIPERSERPTGVPGTVVTWDNLDQIREDITRPPEDASYNVVQSVDWTFQRWDRPSRDAYVENSTRNTRTVFFDVYLDGTEELIYESPYLPVGSSIENFALDTEVQAGSYTATLVYYLVDDDYEVITYLPVMIWLNILG